MTTRMVSKDGRDRHRVASARASGAGFGICHACQRCDGFFNWAADCFRSAPVSSGGLGCASARESPLLN
jgi:hypothetical protein